MVLCGTWSETSIAQSQLTQFWQIPRHRTLSYSLWTPVFVSHDYPLAVEPGSTPRPLVQKRTWRDSLPIDMLLSAVSVLVVAQSSSEIPEGLMNNPVQIITAYSSSTCSWAVSDVWDQTLHRTVRNAYQGIPAHRFSSPLAKVSAYAQPVQDYLPDSE